MHFAKEHIPWKDTKLHDFPGNTDNHNTLRNKRYLQDFWGKLCRDRRYIGKVLFNMLFINGIQLVTRVRDNILRNLVMCAEDKILLRKRAVIETVNDELKNIAQIEHPGTALSTTSLSTFSRRSPLSVSSLKSHR